MNGRVSPILDITVTHLVAAECDPTSEKYVVNFYLKTFIKFLDGVRVKSSNYEISLVGTCVEFL